jgi:UDP-N-acetylmuramyl pentapeptide phosphotransferase/UDP-N-acetylglucosamine-1-phosphate transferase
MTPIVRQPAFPPAALALLGVLFVLLLALAPLLSRVACRLLGLERPNFKGDVIPAGVGLTFLFVAAVAYGWLMLTPAPLAASAPLFLFVALGFGLLGIIDDIWGSRGVGGFQGHLKALFQGRPTTGFLKLLGGGLVALVASYSLHGLRQPLLLLLDAALIALAANALNLLDVRPGRAQFGFLLLSLVVYGGVLRQGWAWVSLHPPPAVLLGVVTFAAAVEWWPDCRGRAMMGDTGSNLLGAVVGLAAALALPLSGRFVLLAVLLAVNLLAEKVSLTDLIERTRWLRALDRQLGAR